MKDYGQTPEKSAAWLEAECLRRCRRLVLSRHLEAVKIERTRPAGSGPNWQLAAFKPELNGIDYHEAMGTIAILRGTYALASRRPGSSGNCVCSPRVHRPVFNLNCEGFGGLGDSP